MSREMPCCQMCSLSICLQVYGSDQATCRDQAIIRNGAASLQARVHTVTLR